MDLIDQRSIYINVVQHAIVLKVLVNTNIVVLDADYLTCRGLGFFYDSDFQWKEINDFDFQEKKKVFDGKEKNKFIQYLAHIYMYQMWEKINNSDVKTIVICFFNNILFLTSAGLVLEF